MVKLVIAGKRDFNDYFLLKEKVDCFIQDHNLDVEEIIIISGGASGADALGEKYAKDNNFPCKVFKADWDSYGRAAGPIRNAEMAANATHAIVFWDGVSRGSLSMINEARKKNLCYRVVNVG